MMVSTASLAIIHVLKSEVKTPEGDMSAELCLQLSNLLRDGVQGWRRRKFDSALWDDSLCKVRHQTARTC